MPASGDGSWLRDFLAELKRRRVFRVAVVYAFVTFGVLQVVDIAFPALKLPDWTITLVVALTLLGFPVAMVLAWAFDITSRGVVRTGPAPADSASGPQRPNPAAATVAVILVVGLTVAAGWYILPKLPGWWTEEGAAAADARVERERQTLVVLPFENLGKPIDEYFADGITEEITARLAGIRGLGVIARTTAVRYKGSDAAIDEIGRELDVDYVLEGTVRWENDPDGTSRVRVTPQLIRVADATHVWADIYEEPIASVFQVQSEIAERVVGALNLTLRESERSALREQDTRNMEAYNYYLLGNEVLASSPTQTSAQQAVELFERAVELDPSFERARSKLAEANAGLYWASFRMLFGVRDQDYEAELDRLYPESFGTDPVSYHLARGILLRRLGRGEAAETDFAEARAILEQRLAAEPETARLHAQMGLASAGLGLDDLAVREGLRAVDLQPLAENPLTGAALVDNLAHIYVLVGDYERAVTQLERLVTADTPVSRPWLRVDPTWDPLRDLPEFQRLLDDGA